jgi:ATP-binding cassette subfamily C (CFTR/MRP) protein 4
MLQEMIRQHFAHATVLTVAHRLKTIMDSDKVLVLDAGRVAEYDAPHTLLQNEAGIFTGMVDAHGESSAAALRAQAQQQQEQQQ